MVINFVRDLVTLSLVRTVVPSLPQHWQCPVKKRPRSSRTIRCAKCRTILSMISRRNSSFGFGTFPYCQTTEGWSGSRETLNLVRILSGQDRF